jgi:hypothetical protein
LAGEERVLASGFPQAWAVDELDWSAGELQRRLRIPMLDMVRLTADERLAFDDPWKPRERGRAEQRYPFRIKRAQLAAGILRQAPFRRREPASAGTVAPASGWAAPIGGDRARKPDPRNKSKAMLDGLERALASGALIEGQPATLKAAYHAMLEALNRKSPPKGMSVDAFAKHCKQWLREHGIYE